MCEMAFVPLHLLYHPEWVVRFMIILSVLLYCPSLKDTLLSCRVSKILSLKVVFCATLFAGMLMNPFWCFIAFVVMIWLVIIDKLWNRVMTKPLSGFSTVHVIADNPFATLASCHDEPDAIFIYSGCSELPLMSFHDSRSLILTKNLNDYLRCMMTNLVLGGTASVARRAIFGNFIPFDRLWSPPRVIGWVLSYVIKFVRELSYRTSFVQIILLTWICGTFKTEYDELLAVLLSVSAPSMASQKARSIVASYIRCDYHYINMHFLAVKEKYEGRLKKSYIIAASFCVLLGCRFDLLTVALVAIYLLKSTEEDRRIRLKFLRSRESRKIFKNARSNDILWSLVSVTSAMVGWHLLLRDWDYLFHQSAMLLIFVALLEGGRDLAKLVQTIKSSVSLVRFQAASLPSSRSTPRHGRFAKVTEDKVRLCRFGTRGDFVPVGYVGKVIRSFGVSVSTGDIHASEVGKGDLESIERGDSLAPLFNLTIQNDHIGFLNSLGLCVIGNSFSTVRSCYSWSMRLHEPATTYGIATEDMFLDFANSATSIVGVDPVGFEGRLDSIPFSGDGENPLTNNFTWNRVLKVLWDPSKHLPKVLTIKELLLAQKSNRRIIICTGSSSGLSPLPLPLKKVDIHVSSREWLPQSEGKRITDIDHPALFRSYDVVVCHGGAGTTKTALASGCDVFSVSTMLDRDLKSGPSLVVSPSPELGTLFGMLDSGPGWASLLCDGGRWVKLILLSISMTIFAPLYIRSSHWFRATIFFWNILIRLSISVFTFLSASRFLFETGIITDLDTAEGVSILGSFLNVGAVFNITHLIPFLRHMTPVSLALFPCLLALLTQGILLSNNLASNCGLMLATFWPMSVESSNERYVEIWRCPVLGAFDHTFIRCGRKWFQFVFHDKGIGSLIFPKMTMEVLDQAPLGNYRVHRTSIPSYLGPSDIVLDLLSSPRPYSSLSNCQTGTLALLRNSRKRSWEAELLLIWFLLKATPLLGLTMLHNLLTGLSQTSYFGLAALGSLDNRVRLIEGKVFRKMRLTNPEIAYLLLSCVSVSVTVGLKGVTRTKMTSSVDLAYNSSKLGPWFSYKSDFKAICECPNKVERKRLVQALKRSVITVLDSTDYSSTLASATGSVKMHPTVIYDERKMTFNNLAALVKSYRKTSGPSKLLSDSAALSAILDAKLGKPTDPVVDLTPYVTLPARSTADPTVPISVIGEGTFSPAALALAEEQKMILLSLFLGVNILVYASDATDKTRGRKRCQKVESTVRMGYMFETTLKVIRTAAGYAILTVNNLSYEADLIDLPVDAQSLPTYVAPPAEIRWSDLIVSWLPKRLALLYRVDEIFYDQITNVASHGVAILTKWTEIVINSTFRFILSILNCRATNFFAATDTGPRVKPGIPMITDTRSKFVEDRYRAVELLGLSPLIQAPRWEVDAIEPEMLISPRLMSNGRSAWEAEDVADTHFQKCNFVLSTVSDDWHLDRNYRRRFNTVPESDRYMSRRRAMAVELMQAEIGVNNIAYATKDATLQSLSRYAKTPTLHRVTKSDIEEYAGHIRSKDMEEYKGFRIWTPERSLAALKRQMNLGYGFEGATSVNASVTRGLRKRVDLLKMKEAKQELLRQIRQDLQTNNLNPMIHTSFPKAFKNFRHKLEGLPHKVRTIVMPDIFSLVADSCIFKSTDLEMKRNYTVSSTAIGLPWKATAINAMVNDLPRGNQNFIFDMVDYDALHGNYVPDLLAEVYGPGFDSMNEEDQDVIKAQIRARWIRLQEGGLIYDLNHGITVPKIRGSSTGSVSVTRPNTEVARFAFCKAFSVLWNVSITEAFDCLHMKTMGDDNMLTHTGAPVCPEDLVEVMFAETGLRLKVEFSKGAENGLLPTWDGATFLSHKISDSDNHKDELERAGIERGTPSYPDYCFIYDGAKLAMRQTLALTKTNAFKEYDSLKSYMQKAVHHPEMHSALGTMAREVALEVRKRPNGMKFLEKRPILNYEEELRVFYVKLHKAKLVHAPFVNPELRMWSTFLQVNTAVTGFLTFMRLSAYGALGAPRPLESSSPLIQTGSFTVERFAYYSHLELIGTEPSFQTFARLCGSNPYSSLTNPPLAWEAFNKESTSLEQREAKLTFYGKYQWLSSVFVLLRFIVTRLQRRFFVFGILNSLYTIIAGTPSFWWGVASELGILANNHASPMLSGMIPRDPYRLSKAAASLAVDCLPAYVFILGVPRTCFIWIERCVVQGIELFTLGDRSLGAQGYSGTPCMTATWASCLKNDIMPALLANRRICVHAPTGSGKSQALGDLLLEHFQRVLYVVPRRAAAENMTGFAHIERNVPWPQGRGKFVMTGGHAVYRLWKDASFNLDNSIVVFDEYDEQEGNQLLAANELRMDDHMFILLSATASASVAKLLDADSALINVPIQSRFNVDRHLAPINSTPVTLCAQNYGTSTRILILEPSLQKCQTIVESLNSMDLDAEVMGSGDPIPISKVVVATQCAEKSVTIPGVDFVIDSGYMIRSDQGELIRSNIDFNTMMQRSGRTGRTNPGTYVTMANPVARDVRAYPAVEIALAFHGSINHLYGLDLDITPAVPEQAYSVLHGSIRISKASVPLRFQSDGLLRLIGSLILQSETVEDLEYVLNCLERGEVNSSTEHVFSFHGETIALVGSSELQKVRHEARRLHHGIEFQVIDHGTIKSGNVLRLTRGGLVTFRGSGVIRDITRGSLIGFNRDSYSPAGENLPNEVSLVRTIAPESGNESWTLHFVSLLHFYLQGTFISAEDKLGRRRMCELFGLPHADQPMNDRKEILDILCAISAALNSDVLFLDCSQIKQKWVRIQPPVKSSTSVNICWTGTGKMYFFRTGVIHPIVDSVCVELTRLGQEVDRIIAPLKHIQAPRASKTKTPQPITPTSTSVNVCAFESVFDLLSDMPKNTLDRKAVFSEIAEWEPHFPDGSGIGMRSTTVNWMATQFAHLRDPEGLTAVGDILQALNDAVQSAPTRDQYELLAIVTLTTRTRTLFDLGDFGVHGDTITWASVHHGADANYGTFTIFETPNLDQTILDALIASGIRLKNLNGRLPYEVAGAVFFFPGLAHYEYYGYDNTSMTWRTLRGSPLPASGAQPAFLGLRSQPLKDPDSPDDIVNAQLIEDFIFGFAPSGLVPPIPKESELMTATLEAVAASPQRICLWGDAEVRSPCLLSACIQILELEGPGNVSPQSILEGKMRTSLSMSNYSQQDLLVAACDALEEISGKGFLCVALRDRINGVSFTLATPKVPSTREYYVLINYHRHIYIGTFAQSERSGINCVYDFECLIRTFEFRVERGIKNRLRSQKPGVESVTGLMILEEISEITMETDVRSRLATRISELPEFRAKREVLKTSINCRRAKGHTCCRTCLALANFISTDEESHTIHINRNPQTRISVRSNRTEKNVWLLEMNYGLKHKVFKAQVENSPTDTSGSSEME